MPVTWSGWEKDLLAAANIIVTPPSMDFLTEWHKHEGGTCNFNPIDLSTKVSGSSRCGSTVAGFGRTQKYGTHGQAQRAFTTQINDQSMTALKAALNTGNPYQVSDRDPVVAALKAWGSPTFAKWYAGGGSMSGGGGGGGGKSANFHKGWDDLQSSLHKTVPARGQVSARLTRAALRSLAKARKVRL